MEMGPAHDVAFDPMHPYTRALISAVPSGDPTVKRRVESLKGEPPSPINVPSGCRFHPRCSKAMPECSEIKPVLIEDEPGHSVACLLFGDQLEKYQLEKSQRLDGVDEEATK